MNFVLKKPVHVWINHQLVGPERCAAEIYDSEAHLLPALKQSVADGKKCFVTSNSRTKIGKIAAALDHEFGSSRRQILITSHTTGSEEVQDFIADVRSKAREYDVVLCSPSIGTGVDISFPDKEKLIDVVFGFFEAKVTTHTDCDQQLARVRDPGAVKVWVSPRRFNFETNAEVVKHDLLKQSLYKNVLKGYSEEGVPEYEEEDPIITMATLIVAQRRVSGNNLRHHFIEHKKRQGYTITFVAPDEEMSSSGRSLLKLGKELSEAKFIEVLLAAPTLRKHQFDAVREQLEDGDPVSASEMCAYHRTRLELFHREAASEDLIRLDNQGRYRGQVEMFTQVTNPFHLQHELPPPALVARSRFVKSSGQRIDAIYLLLEQTPLFKAGTFDATVTIDQGDLGAFVQFATDNKAVLENLLDLDIRSDLALKPVQQLSAVLKLVGLKLVQAGTRRETGQKIYRYRLDQSALDRVQGLVAARARKKGWTFLYETNGWDLGELEKGDEWS